MMLVVGGVFLFPLIWQSAGIRCENGNDRLPDRSEVWQ